MQKVSVSTSLRTKSRVKFGIDLDGMPDRHPLRQVRIHTAHPCGLRTTGVSIEMHHLPKRMHAGVGPTGADGRDPMTRNRCERSLEVILNGAPRGLGLPSVKSAPVVGEHQRQALHAGAQENRKRSSVQARQQRASEFALRIVAAMNDILEKATCAINLIPAQTGCRQFKAAGKLLVDGSLGQPRGNGCQRAFKRPCGLLPGRCLEGPRGHWGRGRGGVRRAHVEIGKFKPATDRTLKFRHLEPRIGALGIVGGRRDCTGRRRRANGNRHPLQRLARNPSASPGQQ